MNQKRMAVALFSYFTLICNAPAQTVDSKIFTWANGNRNCDKLRQVVLFSNNTQGYYGDPRYVNCTSYYWDPISRPVVY